MSTTSKVYRSFVTIGENRKIVAPSIPNIKQQSQTVRDTSNKTKQNYISPASHNLKAERAEVTHFPEMTTKKQSIDATTNVTPSKSLAQLSGFRFKEIKDRSPPPFKNKTPIKRNSITAGMKKSPLTFNSPEQIDCMNIPRTSKTQLNENPQQQKVIVNSRLKQSQKAERQSLVDKHQTPRIEYVKKDSIQQIQKLRSPVYTELGYNTEITSLKSITGTQFLNRTMVVNDLSKQLNLKQIKISDLQDKLSAGRNALNSLMAEHARELKQKDRQKSDLRQVQMNLQKHLKQLSFQNFQINNKLKEQQKQCSLLRANQGKINARLLQLAKINSQLQNTIKNMSVRNNEKVDEDMIHNIKQQLNKKTQKVLQLQRDNEILLRQIQKIRQQSTNNSPLLAYALPKQDDFSVFQESFKTYIQQTAKYKLKIQEKNKEIQNLKQSYNAIRIQNERLKNQLRIQQLRRVTDLRNADTIMNIQKLSLMNQIKDMRHELSVSKEKTKTLHNQIRTKDEFIMKNMKAPQVK